ncbi:hypothetical protein TP70_00395 [Staphylococcus microti]|uniref:Gram-positive cocci surface proteins LPxTG domain-containing protein n=1 Tax=Staphylococcus microti TaxID=569857 RepID=A0A0D6XSH0_9STAP|nr:LPXTG cell wall anchor domain-containing protein [Staphylococcus microti]KIX91774.1 hypothetical protein TP70_00395 [Staphylococcus microti]PNZ84460.1 hypothetical protein CD132_00505 [Staphylococcus microti]SUM58340.1 Uncharacterised protein [Staphylococcus microti]
MSKKTICVSLLATATLTGLANNTFAATNQTDPHTLTDYDILNAPATPVGEEPPYLSNSMTTGGEDPTSLGSASHNQNSNGNEPTNNVINGSTSTTPVQTPPQQVTPDNITPQPAQTPTTSHTNSKVLPNTGGGTQTSTLAIFSILLLGGSLLAYRPVTTLFKSKQ